MYIDSIQYTVYPDVCGKPSVGKITNGLYIIGSNKKANPFKNKENKQLPLIFHQSLCHLFCVWWISFTQCSSAFQLNRTKDRTGHRIKKNLYQGSPVGALSSALPSRSTAKGPRSGWRSRRRSRPSVGPSQELASRGGWREWPFFLCCGCSWNGKPPKRGWTLSSSPLGQRLSFHFSLLFRVGFLSQNYDMTTYLQQKQRIWCWRSSKALAATIKLPHVCKATDIVQSRMIQTYPDTLWHWYSVTLNSQVKWRWNGKVAESVKRYCFNNVCKRTWRNGHSSLLHVGCMSAVGQRVWG